MLAIQNGRIKLIKLFFDQKLVDPELIKNNL